MQQILHPCFIIAQDPKTSHHTTLLIHFFKTFIRHVDSSLYFLYQIRYHPPGTMFLKILSNYIIPHHDSSDLGSKQLLQWSIFFFRITYDEINKCPDNLDKKRKQN